MLKNKRQPKPIRWGLKKICWGLINITVPRHQPRSWIETNFQKRECIKFIPFPKDETKCCCGQSRTTHPTIPGIESGSPGDIWVPYKHTRPQPTDAYGTIEFQGGAHPTKAQYVRLSFDTRPELLVQLLSKEWNLELPKLLITVQGGKANFELQPKLKKEIRKGLIKAAKTTGAWVFTGGTNTGVTRQVGDALSSEGQQRTGRVVSIGIAPWGIVERNHELLGHNREIPCHSISSPRSKLAVLNNRHAYFLLVDNGTQGKYGAELILRRKLERFISNLKLHPFTHSCTPVVCLVIEGGTNTIRAVLEYVTDTPPVPVVVCDGSGRAADLIAFVHKYASDGDEQPVLESMREYLIGTIQKTFEVGFEQAEKLYHELLQCTRNKNLITVFRIQEKPDGEAQELDQTILTALFKSQHLSPPEQLSLALTWNRVDIARTEIFVYGQEWPSGALDEAMMQALEHDRIDFVKLLLENGVSMKKFLTIPRLEELYNTKHGPANTLGYILRDVRPHIPKGYVYTLHDIGLVINKLMGGAYRSYYTRRKFRPIYAKVMNSYANAHRKSSTYQRYAGANSMSLVTGLLPFTSEMALFEYPFNELLMWAVLTKRQEMAMLMWTHGEEALAKSLVACKLYKAMAHEAAEDDLDTEIYDELRNYAKEFETKGIKLLDFCYRQDCDKAQRLLTCELHSWSSQSCLSLAVAANHRALLAHPCSQIILADLWMGALRTRKNTNLKVILGLLFPPFIKKLDFKSKEELQLMPQTEEEHLENQNLDYDDLDKHHPDAENALTKAKRSISLKYRRGNNSAQALLADTYSLRDTKVQENGKVGLTGADAPTSAKVSFENQNNEVSLSDSDPSQIRDFFNNTQDYEARQLQPLRLKKKIYEFYTAPITKFWADSMAYAFFLVMFTYTVLVKMDTVPHWQEIYSIAYIFTLGCEKIREIISSEPVAVTHKFSVWAWNMWNPCDAAAIIFFVIGFSLRFRENTMDIGRVIYCVDSIYWYLRILNILGVNKYLGPLVTMMGKMVKNMIYFVVLLLVVLMSFGISRQAILFPNKPPSWKLLRDVYFQPYFMLYGEVFADDIDPPCGEDPSQKPCLTGHWVTPITMAMYLLIANILLINLLIAVFNNIFNEVNSVSHQVWMFQRFTVVMEYQQKPVLPPPLIAFCHFYSLLKYCIRKAKGLEVQRDNGLKLFLEKDDLERLYDFEEECVEGFFHEQEIILNQSTEARIRTTTNRVENMSQKIEDINQKENMQTATVQNIEFRLRKVEESTDEILSHLAVIHRFMSAHTLTQEAFPGSSGNLNNLGNELRLRTVSVTEPLESTNTLQVSNVNTNRRKFMRSLTEVRSDAYIFDDGTHFEVVPVPEENEMIRSRETLNLSGAGANRKASIQSEDSDPYTGSGQQQQTQKQSSIGESRKPPFLNVRQDTTTSTESKDTLTPLGHPNDHQLDEHGDSSENIMDIDFSNVKQRAMRQRTQSAICRRNSESCSNYDMNRSQMSLNQLAMTKRQLSLTQSEPDSGNEPAVAVSVKPVIQARHPRNLLLQFHTEYTSITDELESVCHMIASPTTSITGPTERPKTINEMSTAECAALIEKQHLKECEENDYLMLEGLLQARGSQDENSGTSLEAFPVDRRPSLRRESAIELSPSKPPVGSDMGFNIQNDHTLYERHSSSESQTSRNQNHQNPQKQGQSQPSYSRTSSELLNPTQIDTRIFRKSCESLQKNSSTETDYSLHPYRVIKQSSNDTTASMTGSFNIDTPSMTAEPSLDAVDLNAAQNSTHSITVDSYTSTTTTSAASVVSNTGNINSVTGSTYHHKATTPLRTVQTIGTSDLRYPLSKHLSTDPIGLQPTQPRSAMLKKQYSMDQTKYSPKRTASESDKIDEDICAPGDFTKIGLSTATPIISSVTTQIQQQHQQQPTSSNLVLNQKLLPSPTTTSTILKPSMKLAPPTSTIKMSLNVLLESSSSTEESKDEVACNTIMPTISTNIVQDEIAKLSSNIKSSTDSEKDPPYNETMC
ncbi:transient receptor potential cation channel trpm isoform X3 [Condylostylus longicornis]|uniref:transient receptor potential cation channel trpm isoform X3 n=1 Tax=Condylostylus longicornis TaxID=2530218 RepID=UPI00244E2E8B|nr:transient receptor potential cation channel trpm isoform X3 [Condylostylus longicornis]